MTLPRLYILSTWIIHTTMTKQYNDMNNQFKWDFTNRFSLCFKKYVSAVCLFSYLSDFFDLLPFSHQWKLIPSLASIHLLGLHLVNYKSSITQLIKIPFKIMGGWIWWHEISHLGKVFLHDRIYDCNLPKASPAPSRRLSFRSDFRLLLSLLCPPSQLLLLLFSHYCVSLSHHFLPWPCTLFHIMYCMSIFPNTASITSSSLYWNYCLLIPNHTKEYVCVTCFTKVENTYD